MFDLIEWRPVVGYEGLYCVSSEGDVIGLKRNKYLKAKNNIDGYRCLQLSKNNKVKDKRVARLVAEAFFGTPPKDYVVNHKDCNKTNDHVKNLEWVSIKENTIHAVKNGCFKSKKGKPNKKSRLNLVVQKPDGEIFNHLGLVSLCEDFDLCYTTLSKKRVWKGWKILKAEKKNV